MSHRPEDIAFWIDEECVNPTTEGISKEQWQMLKPLAMRLAELSIARSEADMALLDALRPIVAADVRAAEAFTNVAPIEGYHRFKLYDLLQEAGRL